MQMRLETINFNHDRTSAQSDAYNIRKNETTPIALPEWQRDVNSKPKDSLAAYSILDTQGKTLTIKASFRVCDPAPQEILIRAIDGGGSVANVLGEVAERKVSFENGTANFVEFELKDSRIWSVGIGVHDIEWLWQFRADATASWENFDRSSHRIYTTLRVPQDPWIDQNFDPLNMRHVWTDVLDHACVWAEGASNDADVSAAIVRNVFDLGRRFIQFDNHGNAGSHYSDDNNFDCTAFLSRLAGEEGNGQFVNCTDCASIVSTFANALGCSLSQARMAPPTGTGILGFPLNPHKRIGLPELITGRGFRYHEVAWEGACGEADDVFDACLLLNANNTPGTFRSKSASNLPFGALGARHYRFRLVPENSQANCLPVKGSAVKRKPGPAPQFLRTTSKGTMPPPPTAPNNFVSGFSFSGFESSGFALQRAEAIGPYSNIPVLKSFWINKHDGPTLIRIDTYECAAINDARNGLLNLLDDFELEGMQPTSSSNGASLEFANSTNSTALFAVANIVFLMRNVGTTVSNLSMFASSLKQYVLPPTEIAPSHEESIASPFRIEDEGVVGRKLEMKKTESEEIYRHYWFSSELGEVSREGNQLFYEPAQAGDHTIRIWSLEAEGFLRFTSIDLRVE